MIPQYRSHYVILYLTYLKLKISEYGKPSKLEITEYLPTSTRTT